MVKFALFFAYRCSTGGGGGGLFPPFFFFFPFFPKFSLWCRNRFGWLRGGVKVLYLFERNLRRHPGLAEERVGGVPDQKSDTASAFVSTGTRFTVKGTKKKLGTNSFRIAEKTERKEE
jgi:hypothetical protein